MYKVIEFREVLKAVEDAVQEVVVEDNKELISVISESIDSQEFLHKILSAAATRHFTEILEVAPPSLSFDFTDSASGRDLSVNARLEAGTMDLLYLFMSKQSFESFRSGERQKISIQLDNRVKEILETSGLASMLEITEPLKDGCSQFLSEEYIYIPGGSYPGDLTADISRLYGEKTVPRGAVVTAVEISRLTGVHVEIAYILSEFLTSALGKSELIYAIDELRILRDVIIESIRNSNTWKAVFEENPEEVPELIMYRPGQYVLGEGESVWKLHVADMNEGKVWTTPFHKMVNKIT